MTSLWARWRLKSSAFRLFTQPFVQAQIKENIRAPRHWPVWGDVNSPHKWPVTRKRSTFDDVIMVNVKMLTHNAAGIAMTFPSSIPVLQHCLTMAYTVRILFCSRTRESLNLHVDIYTDPNSRQLEKKRRLILVIFTYRSEDWFWGTDATQSNITRYHTCHSSKGTKRSWLIYKTFKS